MTTVKWIFIVSSWFRYSLSVFSNGFRCAFCSDSREMSFCSRLLWSIIHQSDANRVPQYLFISWHTSESVLLLQVFVKFFFLFSRKVGLSPSSLAFFCFNSNLVFEVFWNDIIFPYCLIYRAWQQFSGYWFFGLSYFFELWKCKLSVQSWV